MESFKSYKYQGKKIVIDENIKFNELTDDFDVGEEKGKIVDFIDSLKEEVSLLKDCFEMAQNERDYEHNRYLEELMKRGELQEEVENIKFCDKCGMSDANPNSNHHCECSAPSEAEDDSGDDYTPAYDDGRR
jgi:hypothetical protein